MIRKLTTQEIEAAASALVAAEETSLGVEVTMPVVYPDGRAITVVVTVERDAYVVHDAGFGSMYLTGAGVQFSKQIRKRLASMATNYGCEFINGRMMRRASPDEIALAIAMVANASRCVGDEVLEARRRSESDFIVAVTDRLREALGAERVRTNEQFTGESGALYRVHNVILDPAERKAIAFVEPLASRASVSQRFMEFHDLKPVYQSANMYAVTDDDEAVSGPHRMLLQRVCRLVAYSESREAFRPLAA
jgi:hypothetical protein